MNKFVLIAIALLLQAPAARSQDDPLAPPPPRMHAFYDALAAATFAQMPQEREKFGLVGIEPHDPAFASTVQDGYETLHCDDTASLRMVGFANDIGHIDAAICADAARLRAIAGRAREALARTVRELEANDDQQRKLGVVPQQQRLADGSEFVYLPVLLVGHGLLLSYEGLLFAPAGGPAVVVQLDSTRICDPGQSPEPGYFASRPLCKDTPAALLAIARDVREKMRRAPVAAGLRAGTSAAPS